MKVASVVFGVLCVLAGLALVVSGYRRARLRNWNTPAAIATGAATAMTIAGGLVLIVRTLTAP